jgi:molybdopterin adenylyltransferase
MSNSPSVNEHRAAAKRVVRIAVVTISDSRTIDNDTSGKWIVDQMQSAGYELVHRTIVADEIEQIRSAVLSLCKKSEVDAIITTGGTGISPRDRTPEALESLMHVALPGFGELFRMLSYQEIGAASMLSRAFAGKIESTLVFCLPGSTNACRLATEKLLAGELKHLVHHARG